MLTKLVNNKRTDWDKHLPAVLFSYRTAFKMTTRYTPFQLVYGLHPLMPTEFLVPTKRTNLDIEYTSTRVLTARIADLEQMDTIRHDAQVVVGTRQWYRSLRSQQHYCQKDFQLGDYVLWYPKGHKEHVGKFKRRWFGPFRIQYRLPNNTALLVTIQQFEPNPVIVNINKLKPYRFYDQDQFVTVTPNLLPEGLVNHQKGDDCQEDQEDQGKHLGAQERYLGGQERHPKGQKEHPRY